MLLGPIFQVEMVTIARRRRYYLLRTVYGMLMLLILWTAYSQMRFLIDNGQDGISIRAGQELATTFFLSFSGLQMFAILAVGPAMAVGTIASERERRTIEYLFATDLANHEIVLGKIIARLCLLGQFILVGLPVLFVFRMLGGISTDLLLSTFLLASSTALMLTTFSVCVSVWSPRTRDAATRVYVMLAAILILPSIIEGLGQQYFSSSGVWNTLFVPVLELMGSINPAKIISGSFMEGVNWSLITETVVYQILVSILATLLAIAAVRRVHLRESTRGVKNSRKRFRLPRWQRPLGNSPMIWKEVFSGSSSSRLGIVGRIGLVLLMLLIFAQIVTAFVTSISNTNSGIFYDTYALQLITISVMLGSGILILLASTAAGSITSEKERDCWLALLSTPLTAREILWGKICGCLYRMRWPLLLLAFAWGLGIMVSPESIFASLAMLTTIVFTTWFVVNLGLLFSLRSLTTMRAMGATLATLFFVGGGYLFCCCAVMMGGGGGGGIFLTPCLPFLLGFPAYGFAEQTLNSTDSHEADYYVAYVLGTLGYLIAGILIFVAQVNNFDEATGRSCDKPDGLKGMM